jgi:SH3-like domain-containing protein
MTNFLATILGIPAFPSIREVNVRSGPSITRDLLFRAPLQRRAFVVAVELDSDGSGLGGKTYSWFHLRFEDGRTGWVRDDLIECEGDGAAFGYGFIAQRQQAFLLVRAAAPRPADPVVPDAPVAPVEPVVIVVQPPSPAEPGQPAGQFLSETMGRDGVNVRRGPGVHHEALTRFAYRTRCDIVDVKPDDNRGSRFRWAQVRANNATGWVREDYLRYLGDVSSLGLAAKDAYPAPMKNSYWVRDWNTDPSFDAIHYGWDFGSAVGEPIHAGPVSGLVVQVLRCTMCSDSRPSVIDNGLRLNDPGVLTSPAWGFGYGNYVTVRYLSEQLPASTRSELERRNLPNYHLFVIYAHMSALNVQQGQTVEPGQRLGTCGNSGNSTGPHLHLEVRAWNDPNETSTGRMLPNRMDPVVLFRR